MAVAHSPAGQVLCPTDRVTIHAISEENASALLLRKPKLETERERENDTKESIHLRDANLQEAQMWCGYLVETMLVRRDDVSESERLLVSGGVLQHTEQQEAEPRQTKRAQHHHLATALRILLRLLERS